MTENEPSAVVDSTESYVDAAEDFELNVKTMDSKVHRVVISPSLSIEELKKQLSYSTTISEDRQRLIYRGRVLEDSQTISSYAIESGNTIHLIARPENYRELQEANNQGEASDENSNDGGMNIGSLNADAFASALMGGPGFQPLRINQNQDQNQNGDNNGAARESEEESLEPLWQSLLSMQTIMSLNNSRTRTRSENAPGVPPTSSSGALPAELNNFQQRLESQEGQDENEQTDELPMPMLKSDVSDAVELESPFSDRFPHTSLQEIEHEQNSESEMIDPNTIERESPAQWNSDIQFFVGQWIDVKDTVSQWLEATIMEVDTANRRIFVHYNGWPVRWDEFVEIDSPRIAPFRSRTRHTVMSRHLSPSPLTQVSNAPRPGLSDARLLLPELSRMIKFLQPIIDEAAQIVQDSTIVEGVDVDNNNNNNNNGNITGIGVAPASLEMEPLGGIPADFGSTSFSPPTQTQTRRESDSVDPLSTPTNTHNNELDRDEERGVRNHLNANSPWITPPGARIPPLPRRSSANSRLAELANELCPLMDRFGRVMADYAPHMRNISENLNEPRPNSNVAQQFSGSGSPQRQPSETIGGASPTTTTTTTSTTSSLSQSSSYLQPRPNSPEPERTFRSPIVTTRSNLGGLGGPGLDIHLAILSPRIARNNAEGALNQAMTSLTAMLAAQAQLLSEHASLTTDLNSSENNYLSRRLSTNSNIDVPANTNSSSIAASAAASAVQSRNISRRDSGADLASTAESVASGPEPTPGLRQRSQESEESSGTEPILQNQNYNSFSGSTESATMGSSVGVGDSGSGSEREEQQESAPRPRSIAGQIGRFFGFGRR